MTEGRATGEAAERALVRKPQIGDTRPAPPGAAPKAAAAKSSQQRGERTRNDRQRSDKPKTTRAAQPATAASDEDGQAQLTRPRRSAVAG